MTVGLSADIQGPVLWLGAARPPSGQDLPYSAHLPSLVRERPGATPGRFTFGRDARPRTSARGNQPLPRPRPQASIDDRFVLEPAAALDEGVEKVATPGLDPFVAKL